MRDADRDLGKQGGSCLAWGHFVFFYSFFCFLSTLGKSRRVWWCLYLALDKFGFVLVFSSLERTGGFAHFLKRFWPFFFIWGERFVVFFISHSRLSFPV